jgi:hypothetical protein
MDLDNIQLTDEARGRLDYIQEKIGNFLEKIRELVAYDLDSETPAANLARSALDACVLLYAQGGVDEEGVEASARALTKACRRPVRLPSQEPPTDKEDTATAPETINLEMSPNLSSAPLETSKRKTSAIVRESILLGKSRRRGQASGIVLTGGFWRPGKGKGRL